MAKSEKHETFDPQGYEFEPYTGCKCYLSK